MSAPRAARGGDDAGLSSVLGAILLFGLVVSTLATLQVQYVPVWDEKREGRLMDQLSGELARLQADLGRQVANRTQTPLGSPLTLAPPEGFALFTSSNGPGTVAFKPSPAGVGFSFASPRLTLLGQDGANLYMLNEAWDPIAATEATANVASVEHLRIRITNPEALADGRAVTLTLLDDDGAYAGKLVVLNRDSGSEYSLVVRVYSAASATTPITQSTDGWKKTATDQANYYVDALEPAFGFSAVLAAAGKPMTLSWATNMTTAAAALVHTDATTGQVGASGLAVPNFQHSADGGRLVVERQNQRFPAQRYLLEHGALLLAQPDGAAMVAPPAFAASSANGITTVSWAVPELIGAPTTVGGSRSAQVAVVPLGPRVDLAAFAARLTFTLATEHPAVWAAYFDETLRDAGLNPAAGHYAVATGAGTVTLQLFGLTADPASTADDLALRYQDATLSLALLPTG